MKKIKKLCIITSKGGHLSEIMQLNPLLKQYNKFWITFKDQDTKFYLQNEKIYYAFHPEYRNFLNLFLNLLLAIPILIKEQPTHLISAGAGIAIPFFVIGKIMRIRTIYIEPYFFVANPSITGKLLYNIVDLFLVQHKCQKKWYPQAKFWGNLL